MSDLYGDPSAVQQQDPVQIVRRRLWLIFLVAALVTGLAAGYSMVQTPIYQSYTKILLYQQQPSGQDSFASDVMNEVDGLQTLATTMTEIIMTQPVAERVAEKMGSPGLAATVQGSISAVQVGETPLIEITYTDTSPERAQKVAATVGEVLAQDFTELSPTSDQGVGVKVVDEAELPGGPVSPNPKRNGLLGLAAGLLLGVGLAFLLEYLDHGWKSKEDVERAVGVPLLGAIPVFRAGKKG